MNESDIPVNLQIKLLSEKETETLGHAVGKRLFPGSVVLLDGELGTGKTVFARGVGRALGVTGLIQSPTFVILNVHSGRMPFYHFDLYRLDNESDLVNLDIDEYLEDDGVTLVEWAGKFPAFFPPSLHVRIDRVDEFARLIILTSESPSYDKILEEIRLGDEFLAGAGD